MPWRVGTVRAVHDETPTARTLVLEVPDWPGHVAGQHVDIRLTAPDGYSATRSYSVASGAGPSARVEVTVDRVPDGEVSPFLTQLLPVGGAVELRGPLGGWFVWRPDGPTPVQLVGGGSGVVPLMSMLRTHAAASAESRMRLLLSVRDPTALFYADELAALTGDGGHRGLTVVWTREAPAGVDRPPGRLDASLLAAATIPAADRPACFVCGPNGFVEAAAAMLVAAGHGAARIRTERFGPTGGTRR
jgi:ferredoxin-NADP reductase